METVFLVGYYGVGKSVLGKILASRKNLKFLDTNTYIEEKEGKKLKNIISEKGIEYLKDLEKYTIKNKVAHEMIVSTGACLVSDEECRHIIKKTGRVIYLKSDVNNIFNNLKDNYSEYLDNNFSIFTVEKDLNVYKPYYEELENYVISVDGKSIDELVSEILAIYNFMNKAKCHIYI